MHQRLLSVITLLVLLQCWSLIPTLALTDMEAGLENFKKHDYRSALTHFTRAIQANPNDCNALYYEAITLHQLKEMTAAKQAYAAIVMRFPGTEAARNAQSALAYLDPNYVSKFQQQISSMARGKASAVTRSYTYSASNSTADNLPDQARVPYQKEGQHLIVRGYVNNRPIDMVFDSGAEIVVLTKGHLENIGLQAPSGPPAGTSYGVGDGGAQKIWHMTVDLKVGQIERKNFPIAIQEDVQAGMTHPLLGESFFRDFSYTLESAPDLTHGTILFQKRGSSTAFANDSSVVPYKDAGRNMLVSVEVNGRTIPMIFDTGAEICTFTRAQLAQLGVNIPDDAVSGSMAGIAGTTHAMHFNIDRMRLGSVVKQDVPVTVVDSMPIGYPLLGASFLGDLRIDIDNSAHVMRVRR